MGERKLKERGKRKVSNKLQGLIMLCFSGSSARQYRGEDMETARRTGNRISKVLDVERPLEPAREEPSERRNQACDAATGEAEGEPDEREEREGRGREEEGKRAVLDNDRGGDAES
jgi:hypothetical protein